MATLEERTDLKWALKFYARHVKRYKFFRDYYDGLHILCFATAKFQNAFGNTFREFADNLMPVVVDTLKDRLKVNGFTIRRDEDPAEGKAAADTSSSALKEMEAASRDIWRRNRMDVRSKQVHKDSIIEGDSYVIVWPDMTTGKAVLYPNRAAGMAVRFDEENPGVITLAAKTWIQPDGLQRVTLYYADRIVKFITKRKTQGGLILDPAAFLDHPDQPVVTHQFGKVPVFHFPNDASIGMLGKSELKDGIPLNNALNKTLMDGMVAREFFAAPQRWATGIEVEIDPATNKAKYPFEAGGVWATAAENAKFGQFNSSDLGQYREDAEDFRAEIARVTRTPGHYFQKGGDWPSGEALKMADAPMTAKVGDRQDAWGMVWQDVMKLALEIEKHGETDPEVIWKDTTPRDETNQINNIVTKVEKLDVSKRQGLREAGYEDKEIDQFADESLKEAKEAQKMATMFGLDDPGQPNNVNQGPKPGQPAQTPPAAQKAKAGASQNGGHRGR